MGTHSPTPKRRAFTLIELLVVIAIIALFVAMLLPPHAYSGPSFRGMCMNRQKQIAVALIMFNSDHAGKYPWQLSVTNGGSLELISWGQVSPHLSAAVGEYIGTNAAVLICPSDKEKHAAINLASATGANISYFVDIDVTTNNPTTSVITGDRNLIANGLRVKSGALGLSTNLDLNWDRETMHHSGGNLAFADGHAQFVRTNELNAILRDSAVLSNRLCIP